MRNKIRLKRTDGGGAALIIDELREGRKMLERNDETDPTDSDRLKLEGDPKDGSGVSAMAMLIVLLGPARGVVLPPLAVGSPSLDSTKTTSYCPLAVEPLDGVWKTELSYSSSTGGRMLDVAEGV
jgi:hypothetical protein